MSTRSNSQDRGRKQRRSDQRGDDPDPRVSTVPLTTEDGEEVVIEQQNVGPGNQVGAGEFKQSDETALHRDPEDAATEQQRLDSRVPVDDQRDEDQSRR
jgi:hypothetical protein